MSTVHRQAPRFKHGDWVSFRFGSRQVWAQVIEDRGPLGVKGRRLYRIRVDEEPGEVVSFEIPEDDLEAVRVDRDQVIEYLKRGGLISILRSNLGGGKDQPKAWLTIDPDGKLTHTSIKERGLIGGKTVPFFALQGDRIFTPSSEETITFLSSFGLSPVEAQEVVRSIGTAP